MRADSPKSGREYYFDRRDGSREGAASRHSHELCEIYYLREGSCTYTVGEHEYELGSGDIIFVPAGLIHSASYGAKPHTRLLLNFPECDVSRRLLPDSRENALFFNTGRTNRLVDTVFERLEKEYERNDELSHEALRVYAEELLILFARNDDLAPKNTQRDGIIDATARYIRSNFASDVRLSHVAELMSVSPEHLCRTFKREMGIGFNEYLTDCRLSHAEYMIKNEPGRSIGEIAYACGFNDSNYFSYKFRERYGTPPTKFRHMAKD